MSHTHYPALGQLLGELEVEISHTLTMGNCQCVAIVRDFQLDQLRIYFPHNPQQAGRKVQIAIDRQTLAEVARHTDSGRLLPDSELFVIKTDLGLDADSFEDVRSAFTAVDEAVQLHRNGDHDASVHMAIDWHTLWCLANYPGSSPTGLPHYRPSFYFPQADEPKTHYAGLLGALYRGALRFGVWSPDRLMIQPHSLLELSRGSEAASNQQVRTSIRTRTAGEVLASYLQDRYLLRPQGLHLYFPLLESCFLTGVFVVRFLEFTDAGFQRMNSAERAELAATLLSASFDVARTVSLGRTQMAVATLGRGIRFLDDGNSELRLLRRSLQCLHPVEDCRVETSGQLEITYRSNLACGRWPTTPARSQSPVQIRIDLPRFHDQKPVRPPDIGPLSEVYEQTAQILQYNRSLNLQRSQAIFWVAHTLHYRVQALREAIDKRSEPNELSRRISGVESVFAAALALTHGGKYTPDDLDEISLLNWSDELQTFLRSFCTENSRVRETLRTRLLCESLGLEGMTPEGAVGRLKQCIVDRIVYNVEIVGRDQVRPLKTSPALLTALVQEVVSNALEYNDWGNSLWPAVNIEIDVAEATIRVENGVTTTGLDRAKELASSYAVGHGLIDGLGLSLVAELYAPLLCKRSSYVLIDAPPKPRIRFEAELKDIEMDRDPSRS